MSTIAVSSEAKQVLTNLRKDLFANRKPPSGPLDERAPSYSVMVEFLVWFYRQAQESVPPAHLPVGTLFEPETKRPGRPYIDDYVPFDKSKLPRAVTHDKSHMFKPDPDFSDLEDFPEDL